MLSAPGSLRFRSASGTPGGTTTYSSMSGFICASTCRPMDRSTLARHFDEDPSRIGVRIVVGGEAAAEEPAVEETLLAAEVDAADIGVDRG